MFKLILLTAILLSVSSAKAGEITYILIDEWYEGVASSHNSGLLNNEDSQQKELLYEKSTGFSLSESLVYPLIGNKRFSSVGGVKKCNGFQGECLVIDGLLKLSLPSNFDGNTVQKWTWENYSYTTSVKKEYSLLGNKLHVTEILATCTECTFNKARFEFDNDKGITSIKLSAEGATVSYLLGSSTGFLAKD
ncbi:hypothetical protein [Shewanella xiamenensis]|uniref:hypothetical protein n=1 Tax=Shewanella xiamenensis TaxID=332186 RepID=UPI0024A7872A|nr:hypothetical protein [Shewanella xiamenensis]MDI5838197.1 hypothetical protein [Shewanella xiamenensis]MDI5842127.1 hypothetical protein [Shewanella xiamenensis]MDI5846066.1 hypothetical protein [Shewanella xiamenensis]MDI5850017.1 hypothetical protein [Shewanella xiamenensis]MDI5854165.1 hypothetical protein [Shewanella xiamenensis]